MKILLSAIRNLVKECRLNGINLKALLVDEVSKKKIEEEIPDTDVRVISGNEPYASIELREE
jgi:hypothetical protein